MSKGGDLTKGFARIYCENCKKSMLLPFSCIRLRPPGYAVTRGAVVASTPHRARRALVRGPSCHEKKVLLVEEELLAPEMAYANDPEFAA